MSDFVNFVCFTYFLMHRKDQTEEQKSHSICYISQNLTSPHHTTQNKTTTSIQERDFTGHSQQERKHGETHHNNLHMSLSLTSLHCYHRQQEQYDRKVCVVISQSILYLTVPSTPTGRYRSEFQCVRSRELFHSPRSVCPSSVLKHTCSSGSNCYAFLNDFSSSTLLSLFSHDNSQRVDRRKLNMNDHRFY